MKIQNGIKFAKEKLNKISDNPSFEAKTLLSFALNVDKIFLITNENFEFDESYFLELLNRRLNYEPIEYITNRVSFYSEEFIIKSGVLIPRPETELLIDEVLKLQNISLIAEIGVGSGVISTILAKKLSAKIVGTDINPLAISLTKENCEKFGVSSKISLFQTNLLDGVDGEFDLIVSNPPYIQNSYNIPNPLKYEPKEALFGGVNGNELILQIIDLAFKRNSKYLICEIGYDQQSSIREFLKDKVYIDLRFYKDYSNFDRGFVLQIRD